VKWHIQLRGVSGEVEGRTWESQTRLRAGRLANLEIVLDDNSVSRLHAEVRATGSGWGVRDLKSTNGTFVNGDRLEADEERHLQERDVIQFGKVAVVVEALGEQGDLHLPPARENLLVEATTRSSWEDALQGLAYTRDRSLRPGQQLLALFRAGHHLGHIHNEDDLLHSILNDAVGVLDAQRGAIVLADDVDGTLRLRALASGRAEPRGRIHFSQSIAHRSFEQGESILCCSVGDYPDLAQAQSIAEGAMASVLCVVLRTPRKRLGVLHLDRSYWQKPFTEDDLHLADALAANVSAGIESAQLLAKQRDLFFNTITVLAQSVELRDPYTGNHTVRVTNYSLLLAEELKLSAEEVRLIRIGTPLHDFGKIGIEETILRKPGRLSPEEFEIMKSHTTRGEAILKTVPDLVPALPIVRSHHEQWDGQGYPDGLVGDSIPRLARIVAVCDAFDAMTSDRPYRKGLPPEAAFADLEKQSGQQFDRDCVAAFCAIRERVVEEMQATGTVPGPVALLRPRPAVVE
jgi:HD-GYP domain-containing protein (c-di-GMP phosphodiesterase class II)